MSAQRSNDSTGDTGTRDITYDLVSVIYHSLQGAETTAMFVADAEQEGNQEISQFFNETKQEYERRAERAKQLLTTPLGKWKGRAAAGGQPYRLGRRRRARVFLFACDEPERTPAPSKRQAFFH